MPQQISRDFFVSIPDDNSFEKRQLADNRIQLTERVKIRHFWPIFTAICGLMFVTLTVFIVWGLSTGAIRESAKNATPPMIFLLLICAGMAWLCLLVVFKHIQQTARQKRYAPAVISFAAPLHYGKSTRLSAEKKLLRPAQADSQAGEMVAQLQLYQMTREAPTGDSDYDRVDSQGKYSTANFLTWSTSLKPVPVSADGHFAATWEISAPTRSELNIKPNVMSLFLLLTIHMKRGGKELLEPLKILLPLE